MGEKVNELFIPYGPITGKVFAVAVTSTSAHKDLTGANYTVLLAAIQAGRMLEITCDDDVFYRWSTATSGETVDETITTASGTQANMTPKLFAGERKRERAHASGGIQGLVVKSTAASTILRITICGRSPSEIML